MKPEELEKILKLMVKYNVDNLQFADVKISKMRPGVFEAPKQVKTPAKSNDPFSNDPLSLEDTLGSIIGDLPPDIESQLKGN